MLRNFLGDPKKSRKLFQGILSNSQDFLEQIRTGDPSPAPTCRYKSNVSIYFLQKNAFFNQEIFSDNLNNAKREYSQTLVNMVRLYIAKRIKLSRHFLVTID